MGVLATVGFALVPALLSAPQTTHAYWASVSALAIYALIHTIIGCLITGFAVLRARAGYVSAQRRLELQVAGLWWNYTAATGLLIIALIHVVPHLVAR